ncbi:MAG TPA: hypothetical protein VME70_04070 [Mycobacteriales bacterium]|nr:hypothetical protein [Mycobacteriales bacterium]
MTATWVLYISAAGLTERPVRPWHRGLVRLRGDNLDRRIAAGESTDSGRLIAARARELMSDGYRAELATFWEDVLLRADRQLPPRRHEVAVSRSQVHAAEREVDELVELLRSRRPVSARGIAMASLLLSDGAGPVFRRTAPRLSGVLRAVIDVTGFASVRGSFAA